MLKIQGSSRLRDLMIAVILSAVGTQFSVLILFFTVPLFTLYYKRGSKDLLIGAGSVLIILLVLSAWKTRSVDDADLRGALVVVEMIIPILLMLGMFFVIDIIPVLSGLRRLYRLFIATAAAVLVFVPVFMALQQNEVFIEAVSSQINAIADVFIGDGTGTYESEIVKTYFGEEGILGYLKNFYLKSAAVMYFLVLLINMRVSEILISRMQQRSASKLTDFSVPEILLWPMLLTAVGMLIEVFEIVSLGFVSPLIWNAGIILLFVYGLQGLGIIRSLLGRFKLPYSFTLMVEMFLILILLIPGINYIVIIGLPVLGVSETWINLRKPIRST